MPVAYVQPKPGARVTEQELLEHAALTIPERAAIPKRIKISPSPVDARRLPESHAQRAGAAQRVAERVASRRQARR